jgi:hypothetical protein
MTETGFATKREASTHAVVPSPQTTDHGFAPIAGCQGYRPFSPAKLLALENGMSVIKFAQHPGSPRLAVCIFAPLSHVAIGVNGNPRNAQIIQ